MKKPRPHRNRNTRRTARPFGSSRIVRNSLPLRMLSGLEPLEPRQMLAANVLASGSASLLAAGTQFADLTVDLPTAPAGSEAVLKISVSPRAGSGLDPAAVTIVDSSGTVVGGQVQVDDVGASLSSETTASLAAGQYEVRIASEGGAGGYNIEVSLVGDVGDGPGRISEMEQLRASAAAVQFYGTGNFVTDLFYDTFGIDMGVPQADPGMDGNGDGVVDGADLLLIDQNMAVGQVNVFLEMDSEGPAFGAIGLTDDTGSSATDGVTTDVTTQVAITDESTISTLTGSLNGGSAVDLIPLVGDFNSTGSFVLEPADFVAINGGTLTDGINTLTLNAMDERGNASVPATFSFTLITNNQAPTGSVPDQTTNEDEPFSLNLTTFFSDPNADDVLSFSASGLPNWLSLSPNGTLSGTPGNDDVGTASAAFLVTDSQGLQTPGLFQVEVVNVNDAPVLASEIPDQNAAEDTPFNFDFGSFFTDPDVGDTISFSVITADGFDDNGDVINGGPLPDWLTADETDGILSGTPGEGDQGQVSIGIIAVDTVDGIVTTTFVINVAEMNDPPTLDAPILDQTVDEDQTLTLNLSDFFSDPEGETLAFTAESLPSWLVLNSTGVLSGVPDDGDDGVSNVTVTATDSFGAATSTTFSVTAVNVNDLPVIQDQSFNVDPAANTGEVIGTVIATDDDVNEVLTFDILSGNDNGTFGLNSANGTLTIADDSQLVNGTTQTLTVQVTDGDGATDTAVVTIRAMSNSPPVAVDDVGFSTPENVLLTIASVDVTSNDSDPDNDTLSVDSVSNTSAQGATVSIVNGSIEYDPRNAEALIALGEGELLTDTFTYVVSDGNGATDTATVSVVVTGVDLGVRYRLEVQDTSGNSVSTVSTGQTVVLVSFVEDITSDPQGVFSAFVDVDYTLGLISPSGSIVHSSTYQGGTFGSNAVQGLLDNVGGVDGISPLGGDEFELFRQTFDVGDSAGVVIFTTNETEDQIQHPTLLFGDSANFPLSQIDFRTTTLTITAAGSVSSSATGGLLHNFANPYDVNGDTAVSPLDALLVINALESGIEQSDLFLDVNADQGVSPLDALLVINELVNEQNAVAAGTDAGGVNTGPNSDVATNDLADALDALFGELDNDVSSGFSISDLQSELSPELFAAINEVFEADEEDRDDLWAGLADDLAEFLNSDLG